MSIPFVRRLLPAALILCLLTLAGWLVYGNALNNPFAFDDRTVIVKNSLIRDLSNTGQFFRGEIDSQRHFKGGYRPLVMTSFALNYHYHSLDPYYYRLVNLGLHLLNAFLLFLLARLLFRREPKPDEIILPPALYAGLIALFFLTHPVQTQAINFIWKRSGILSSTAILLAVICFLQFCRRQRVGWYLIALLCLIGGFFVKEDGLIIPLLFVAIFFLSGPEQAVKQRRMTNIVLLILPCLLAIGWFFLLQGYILKLTPPGRQFILGMPGPLKYFIIQIEAIYRYLGLCLMPFPLNIDYQLNAPASVGGYTLRGLGLIGLLLLCWLALRQYRRQRLLPFATAAFFILLIPTSSFKPLFVSMDEHRLYLPIAFFGLGLLCVLMLLVKLTSFYRRWPRASLTLISFFFFCLCLLNGVGAHYRNLLWQDERLLWQDALAQNPDNVRALTNLAFHANNRGEYMKGRAMALGAIQRNPAYHVPYLNLGTAYIGLEEYAAAIRVLQEALSIFPDYYLAHHNLAWLYIQMGRFDEAEKHALRLPQLRPDYPAAGDLLQELNLLRKGEKDLDSILPLLPNYDNADAFGLNGG